MNLDEFEQEDLQVMGELWEQHITEEAAMKYTVTVTRTEFAVIDVEADNAAEADELAYLEATENYEGQCWETSSIDMVTGEGVEEDDEEEEDSSIALFGLDADRHDEKYMR